jgi:TldD protein
MAPNIGGQWGNESLNVFDDGLVPWGVGSSPVDDEGTPQRRRTLLDQGKVSELLYDVRHAGAFDTQSTGNAVRGRDVVYQDWRRFLHAPGGTSTTLVIEPGDRGSDEELAEAAGEGLWVQQLGWAIPDPYSGAFGGEIRLGYRIRGGRLSEPVRGGTVGGIALAPPGTPSLLQNVAGIGSMPTLAEGLFGPTLLVKPLTVAGSA